jgi:3-oxoisoapionate decarboxylase
MLIGIDSYSYHRLFGEIRAGEEEPEGSQWDLQAVLRHALELGVDGVSLETCFLSPPGSTETRSLREDAAGLQVAIAWGHRHGLEFGARQNALADLQAWLGAAAELGCSLVRCVAASPAFRGRVPVEEQLAATVAPLRVAAAEARALGLTLAVENHGDLTARELLDLIERVDDGLGVCLDTANAYRVGDDPLEAAALLAPLVRMVHLKDVESLDHVTDPIAGPCSVPFGEGVIPIAGVLEELDGAGFAGLVCVELGQIARGQDELELVAASVAWLQRYSKG